MPSITVSGVAIAEMRVVTGVLAVWMALISSNAPGRVSGCATRRIEGFEMSYASDDGPCFRDSISAASVGVADDFGYECLDKGKRKLVNVVDTFQAQRGDKSRATP